MIEFQLKTCYKCDKSYITDRPENQHGRSM